MLYKAQKKFIEFHKEEGSCLWYPEKYLLGNAILGSKSFLERIRHHLPKEIGENDLRAQTISYRINAL